MQSIYFKLAGLVAKRVAADLTLEVVQSCLGSIESVEEVGRSAVTSQKAIADDKLGSLTDCTE